MEILISIKDRKIKIILQKDQEVLDTLEIKNEYKLSEELLPAIDKLLKRNKLKTKEIKKIKADSDQGENFTTTRIAKAVANAWNWARKMKK